ncbi:hypothetical protein NDU88_001915 [Pleurodeles waltl]|uniref:Uncharacterized protein n=1 Tax=Pleurodeles waltl TaxID=8319 RepID=A0AAV7MMV2_PLEWA|nr:hypothetical protein NDU88_001915 [Pleurodeles waltl]
MDRMSERLDKQAERLDQAERGRLSALERELAQLELEQELNAYERTLGRIRAKLTEFQDTAGQRFNTWGNMLWLGCMGKGRGQDQPQ